MNKETRGQDTQTFRTRRRKKTLIVSVLAFITVAISARAMLSESSTERAVKRQRVQTTSAELTELIKDVNATGKILAANTLQVFSPQDGRVTLLVSAGDKVTTGQAIAEVQSPELNNKLEQEQSELTRLEGELSRTKLDARRQTLLLTKQLDMASVELKAAQRESRRAKTSIQSNIISQIDFEKAEDELARASLTVEHAKQEVQLAEETLAFEVSAARNTLARQQLVVDELIRKVGSLKITASVEGVVGNLFVGRKTWGSANQPLLTLVDLTAYEAEIHVAESYANQLALGMEVELKIGRQHVMGSLSAISPEVTEREVTARVQFDQTLAQHIRQNQQISARILLENRTGVLKVRRGNFLQDGGTVAYKIEGDIANLTHIETGATSIREVEILSGLQPGDDIIISGYQSFEHAPSILLR